MLKKVYIYNIMVKTLAFTLHLKSNTVYFFLDFNDLNDDDDY